MACSYTPREFQFTPSFGDKIVFVVKLESPIAKMYVKVMNDTFS